MNLSQILGRARAITGTKPKLSAHDAFIAELDRKVVEFGLDPNLPEILHLREHASRLVEESLDDLALYLLDPEQNVMVDEESGLVVLAEHPFTTPVLKPWTVAKWHLGGDRLKQVDKMVADGTGLTLFVDEKAIFRYEGAAINPTRLADSGNRYRNVAITINVFTGGFELDPADHYGRTAKITIIKHDDGGWRSEAEPLHRVA